MRAMVTGGAGFIGSHIVDRLVRDGADLPLEAALDLEQRGRAQTAARRGCGVRAAAARRRRGRHDPARPRREAARAQYLQGADHARRARCAESFLSLPHTPLPDWAVLKRDIEERRGSDIS